MKRYWYKITTYECPICGRGDTYRERQYTQKPKEACKRYVFREDYDYCDV